MGKWRGRGWEESELVGAAREPCLVEREDGHGNVDCLHTHLLIGTESLNPLGRARRNSRVFLVYPGSVALASQSYEEWGR